jgi:hypothetical protein
MLPSFIEEYELNDKSICNALLGLYQEGYKRGLTNDGVVETQTPLIILQRKV